MIKAYKKRKEDEAEEKITLAYIQSAWTIQFLTSKKKPDLSKILKKKEENRQMSDEEMLEKIKTLNSMLGGEVIGS